jgi:NADPH:quinone reductase-like Zn-dependent oxidoreductase
MKFQRVTVTKRGGPQALHVEEVDLRQPSTNEVRVRILAAPVSLPDVEARYGRTPFAPRIPFVPGYAVIGKVDAIGGGVAKAGIGDKVAALTVHGGYAEYIYLDEKELIPVPMSIDPVRAAPLILNYIVAYQSLHRLAEVKGGDRILIIGASGGIGTAFLELGKIADCVIYGIASERKHHILTEYGATPIDYHTEDFVEVIQTAEPDGLDAVFDGVGGEYVRRGFEILRPGGKLVTYANPGSYAGMIRHLGRVITLNLLPNKRSATLYSTGQSRLNRRPFLEDWASLFVLLEGERITPIIAEKFPISEAAKANELLESGQVVGNIVLVGSELL